MGANRIADGIAMIHGLWVVTNMMGPLVSWRWPKFRFIHLSMMATTFLIMVSGHYCPLTIWERNLRAAHDPAHAFSGGFIHNYLIKVIPVDFSPWIIFVALLFWLLLWSVLYFSLPRFRAISKSTR